MVAMRNANWNARRDGVGLISAVPKLFPLTWLVLHSGLDREEKNDAYFDAFLRMENPGLKNIVASGTTDYFEGS